MRTIQLTQGQVALVDDADYEWLSQWKWCVSVRRGGKFYAVRRLPNNPDGSKGKIEYMHRAVANCARELFVDHANTNTLDNRRHNLRACTASQNSCNRRVRAACGYKGVSWHNLDMRWKASICVNGEIRSLGYYDSKIAAAISYNIAAVQLHGEFARLNDVFSGEVA